MNEFALIDRIVAILGDHSRGEGVLLGPGDDAALVRVPSGHDLAVTTDTLVAGRHFPPDAPGDLVGHRALGVNLSDLAAMGAEARYCVVALTIPESDTAWIEAFACGLADAAGRHDVAIVGGNLSRGPLSIAVAAHGIVPCGKALLRSGACPGDGVFVSGPLGAGHAARLSGNPGFYRVEARLGLGVALRDAASAAIDISDGLLADLGHVCAASGVAAEINLASLPLADGVDAHTALSCGDDYELLFTAKDVSALEVPVYAIGKIVPGTGVTVLEGGQALPRDTSPTSGFRHFQ